MYKEVIQDSIDYIEDNIKCEISAQELSERAGFSVFHYYRLFQTAVGLPVMQYILRRRLLNAIYDIKCGNKMIDVHCCMVLKLMPVFTKHLCVNLDVHLHST